jgi:serine/threonine protein phosphatase 1
VSVDREGDPGRLVCIGDVHGCAQELAALLEALAPGPEDRLVFLGDYVDRGPESRATLDLLVDLRARLPRTVFLRGNHEEMLLAYLGLGGHGADIFLRAGGVPTLASYGLEVRGREAPSSEAVRASMPTEHLDFLREGLRLHHEAGAYLFVHAGVRPGVGLARQDARDLLWIREEFLSAEHGFPHTVVFGHTPLRDVWFDARRKIGLDTGCVYGGRLSAIDLTEGVLHQVRRGTSRADRRSIRRELALP